jgi:chemotaxis protein histidine kinase CheA
MERRPINRVVQPMEDGLPEVPPTEVIVDKHPEPQPSEPTPSAVTDEDWAKEIEREKAEQEAVLKKLAEEEKATEQKVTETQQHEMQADQKIAELERQLAELKAQQAKPVQEPPKPQPQPVAPKEPKQEAQQPAPSAPVNPLEKLQQDELGGTLSQNTPEANAPKEEIVDPVQKKHDEIATKNNCSNRVFTDNGTEDDLDNAIITYDREDQRDEEAKEESPSPGIIAMSLCAQAGQKTKQARMMNRYINELKELNQKFEILTESVLRLSKITPRLPKNDKTTPIHLSGDAAKIAVLSRTQGLYRIMLYNSGFWITVRPLTVSDASAFVHEVDNDFKELGRILGGQFHLVLGAYLKQKVLEILPNVIVSSNLEDWDQPDVLGEAISMHDYDTILWGICCSMYRDGIGIGVHCTNMECRHIDANQYVDLTKACYINPDVFNEEAMTWMRDTRVNRTLDDCLRYRNTILKSTKTLPMDDNKVLIHMRVPSIQTYTKRSVELIGKMQSAIYRAKTRKNQELQNQVIFHIYKMLAPWISSIVYKNESDADVVIEGYDAICADLEARAEQDHTLYSKLEEYIRDTKCSMYCLTSIECPKCHKKPNLNSEGLFPLDVEYLFFGLTCLKLEQTGAQL